MTGAWQGLHTSKKVDGLKRTFVVDTQGRLWLADVDAANQTDGLCLLGKDVIVTFYSE